jgi:hypothetical protein
VIKVKFSPARSKKRQSVRFRSGDFHATSSVIEMVLRDLNSEGMSIETRQQLRVGASYPFRIRRGKRSVLIDGNVIWCKLARMIDIGGGESQALYRAGIAFSSRRLEEFSAVRSSGIQARGEVESTTANDAAVDGEAGAAGHRPLARSAVSCPDCRVPAVVGAQRCGLCGTILPQV